eukprot:g4664.t1
MRLVHRLWTRGPARMLASVAAHPTHIVEIDRETQTITFSPQGRSHSATVLFMHGLGDTAAGWADAIAMIAQRPGPMSQVRFVLPTAPLQPVTLNMGMVMPSWYDILGEADRASETCDGLDESRAAIEALLRREMEEGAVPLSRVVIGGFSQGGALALWTGLQLQGGVGAGRGEPRAGAVPAGVLCMSGYMPRPGAFKCDAEPPPVLFCHGDADPMVKFEYAEAARDALASAGADVTFERYRGMEHCACREEIDDVGAWLEARLPATGAEMAGC